MSYPSDDVFTTIDGVRPLKPKEAPAEQFGGLAHDKKIITYDGRKYGRVFVRAESDAFSGARTAENAN